MVNDIDLLDVTATEFKKLYEDYVSHRKELKIIWEIKNFFKTFFKLPLIIIILLIYLG